MAKPASHSEIELSLNKLGLEQQLTSPPREYLAVISETGTVKTSSVIFRHPQTTNVQQNADMVIPTLLEQHLGIKVSYGEYLGSTLEYLLETLVEEGITHTSLSGNEIRYVPKLECVKPTRKFNMLQWKTLGNNVSIQICERTPGVIDNDQATVEVNINEAKIAIQQAIDQTTAQLQALRSREASLNEALRSLE